MSKDLYNLKILKDIDDVISIKQKLFNFESKENIKFIFQRLNGVQ